MGKKLASDKIAGISDAAVTKATKKTWAQWLKILDAAGAKKMAHKDIAAHVRGKYPDVGGWWSQMVTVGYEQARGLRKKHQKTSGYSVSRSKTIAAPIAELFKAWKQKRHRARWLGDESIEIRKATASKSMRVTWSDRKTVLSVHFYSKGRGKSQVTVQHEKLPSARSAERMKTFWGEKLAALKIELGRS